MSCFDSCPPCKGCVAKDEVIAALRRELSEARGVLRRVACALELAVEWAAEDGSAVEEHPRASALRAALSQESPAPVAAPVDEGPGPDPFGGTYKACPLCKRAMVAASSPAAPTPTKEET